MYFPLSNCHKNPDMCWKYIEFSLTDFFPQSASLYKALCPYWSKYCIVLKFKFFQNSVPTILKVKQLCIGKPFKSWVINKCYKSTGAYSVFCASRMKYINSVTPNSLFSQTFAGQPHLVFVTKSDNDLNMRLAYKFLLWANFLPAA